MIQINVFPDITNIIGQYKASDRSLLARAWVQRRHLMHDRLRDRNRDFGLRVDILVMHRLHGVPPPFNTDFDWLMVKSSPDNEYDQNVIQNRFGSQAIHYLYSLEQKREESNYFKGFGLVRTRTKTKPFYNPMILK